jgi:hypothetical protein
VLNHAIHIIALTRCRLDQTTKEFMAKGRRRQDRKEALRALKSHIANDIYRHMKADCWPRSELVLTTFRWSPSVARALSLSPSSDIGPRARLGRGGSQMSANDDKRQEEKSHVIPGQEGVSRHCAGGEIARS